MFEQCGFNRHWNEPLESTVQPCNEVYRQVAFNRP